jgi:hypothetical protein
MAIRLAVLGTAFALVSVSPPAAAREARGGAAHAAHVLNGDDNASLHLVHSSGSTLFEEGHAAGALPGGMRAELQIGNTFSGSFTLFTRNGQIRGRGRATPHGSGRYETFGGTATITGGTGRYQHAHGSGGFYGELDRRTLNVKVQIRGHFDY